jgi:hypothetical protein
MSILAISRKMLKLIVDNFLMKPSIVYCNKYYKPFSFSHKRTNQSHSDLFFKMKHKLTLFLFQFLLILVISQLNEANLTETCETVACLREEWATCPQ